MLWLLHTLRGGGGGGQSAAWLRNKPGNAQRTAVKEGTRMPCDFCPVPIAQSNHSFRSQAHQLEPETFLHLHATFIGQLCATIAPSI